MEVPDLLLLYLEHKHLEKYRLEYAKLQQYIDETPKCKSLFNEEFDAFIIEYNNIQKNYSKLIK